MLTELYYNHVAKQIEKRDEKNIKKKLAQCEVVPLSKEQKQSIEAYYQKVLGRKVPTFWHEYFFSRNGFFSEKYIPTSVYHSEIVFKLNYHDFRLAYVDKGLYDTYFYDVNRPKTIIKNINGYYYNDKKNISEKEALDRCMNLSSAVIKPSLEGMWGRGVMVFSSQNGITSHGDTIKQIFSKYKHSFIIQEKVLQHKEMMRLNPSSLNTLRIMTYRDMNQVHVLYAVVRIGRTGQSVDNETAGGINADVDLKTGKIRECAYGTPKEKKILTTDVGTVLDGFHIPSFHETLSLAKDLHPRLPYFNLIGWDFGIEENGQPILIEWNRAPDLSQTAHGPAFGEMTDEILSTVRRLPNTKIVKLA